ncbi:hypothetical protein JTB14_009033 [Gonioctena quinquepunctata]|nr:hypothetical protein JTB14_009033 [Gonioctena quinquepunctata]
MQLNDLISSERRLMNNQMLGTLYLYFLNEYEQLGRMTDVIDFAKDEIEYYTPHHGVLKESSSTTQLRVVFNASAPSADGLPIDLPMCGPIIQQNISSNIIRFRMSTIVISSDIKMMYRQVLINSKQNSLQKIVWRTNPNHSIKSYQLITITYGTTAASFLAIRCLHGIANECETEHLLIANMIRNDMYVDDSLTSVESEKQAKYICTTILQIFSGSGFELRE